MVEVQTLKSICMEKVNNLRSGGMQLSNVPKELLKESYKAFVRSFESYIGKKDPNEIDSKTTIRDFLREDLGLYKGNEITASVLWP